MNQNRHTDGQYRRPRIHFSPMKLPMPGSGRRSLLTGSALLMALALLMTLAMIPLRTGDPDAAQTSRDAAGALQGDCAVIQHIVYHPCGHQVTRRVALPAELAGKGRSDLEAAYDAWQVTVFSPQEVRMEQRLDMFCPQHFVLLPDESGRLCAWQNRYGDALALVKELGVAAAELPDAAQTEVRQGKAFDDLESLEKWLESIDS